MCSSDLPAGVTPVLRFKTPLTGEVTWDDEVKGPITFANAELDDLVIAPTRERPMLAIRAGGRGSVTKSHLVWSSDNGPDVPTPATDGNLVFQGRGNGELWVYAADSGKVLKVLDTGSHIMAAPSTYTVAGEQYVAVQVGYGGAAITVGPIPASSAASRYENANRILVFKLGGGAVPKPPAVAPDPFVEPPAPLPSTEGLRKTAFDAIQRRQGGTFAEWEGWDWISDFGDPINEHHAVRETVGVWDESPLQKWIFRGKDALKAVDYCFVNDMASMQVGQARYSAFCDEHGRMLGDGVAFNTGDETNAGILVVTALPSDVDQFRRVAAQQGFDVEILDRTEEWPHVQVQGPKSRDLISALTDFDVESLKYFRFTTEPITIGGVPGCYLARTGYSGELGFEIYVPREGAEALWQALLDEGASRGIRPYGLAAVESLRIESGLIFIGYDYFQGLTSPFHMNLDRTINLETGDLDRKSTRLNSSHT